MVECQQLTIKSLKTSQKISRDAKLALNLPEDLKRELQVERQNSKGLRARVAELEVSLAKTSAELEDAQLKSVEMTK